MNRRNLCAGHGRERSAVFGMLMTLALLLPAALPVVADVGEVEQAWSAYLAGDLAAVATLRRLAEAGVAAAQYRLGTIYGHGVGLERDHRAQLAWYERAAAQGYAPAEFSLGFLLYQGAGSGENRVAADKAAAARWLVAPARRGDASAQALLCRLYHAGEGVAQDLAQAIRLCREAAERGVAGAQLELAVILGNRLHAPAAWVEAYKWALLAERAGHPGAAQLLPPLATRLNRVEIAEAEAAAKAWRAKN